MTYKPEQREVPLRILASPGWLKGSAHLPPRARLLDHLDHAGPFITLTDAKLGQGEHALPFFALQTRAITAIVPPETEAVATRDEVTAHQVWILTDQVVVTGRLKMLPGVRVSDFVLHHQGYLRLEDAFLRPRGHAGENEERFPVIFLNGHTIVGMAEVEPAQPAHHP
ncbi:MAG: hypothetical protein JST54_14695 [Deltaproteobacteria bacterium]|nr:hypothetical protein [Deltaproteobacteria bacterium]